MHYCHLCGERIENKEGYIGTKEENLINSCFNCYIGTLEPIKFDNEKVRYPLVGLRDIGVCQHSCRINYFSILKDSSNLKFNQATALRLLAC